MARRVHTGCRDCTWCTSSRFSRNIRRSKRNFVTLGTLGVAGMVRHKCMNCAHPMYAHQAAAAVVVQETPRTTAAPPAGWFVDQADSRYLRWWDGQRFTEHVKPVGT